MPKRKNPKKSKRPRKTPPKKSLTNRKNNQLNKIALGLMVFGILFVVIPLLFYFNQTIQLSFFTPKAKAITVNSTVANPIEVSVPAIEIQLPLKDTKITNGAWEIAEDGVSYLSTSAKPGQKGAIILYAHNTPDRFGKILKLSPGKTIILRSLNGKNHVYTIEKTMEVFPHQMEVFEQNNETLIMYTCSGFADIKRFIVIAKPSE